MNFHFGHTKIKVRLSFFIVSFIMIALNYSEQFFILAVCTTMHEAAHILTAAFFGLKCRKLSITPIGEIAVIDGLETLALYKRLAVVCAGILINLLIALFTVGDIRNINIALAVFNVLPLYPFDGGRILYYVLCGKIGVLNADRTTSKISRITACIVVILGFIQTILYTFNVSLLCIGIYALKINKNMQMQRAYTFYKLLLNNKPNSLTKIRAFAVNADFPVKNLLCKLSWDYYTLVYVHNSIVNQNQIVEYVLNNGIDGCVGEILNSACK